MKREKKETKDEKTTIKITLIQAIIGICVILIGTG